MMMMINGKVDDWSDNDEGDGGSNLHNYSYDFIGIDQFDEIIDIR